MCNQDESGLSGVSAGEVEKSSQIREMLGERSPGLVGLLPLLSSRLWPWRQKRTDGKVINLKATNYTLIHLLCGSLFSHRAGLFATEYQMRSRFDSTESFHTSKSFFHCLTQVASLLGWTPELRVQLFHLWSFEAGIKGSFSLHTMIRWRSSLKVSTDRCVPCG